jgi:hypothetical protein
VLNEHLCTLISIVRHILEACYYHNRFIVSQLNHHIPQVSDVLSGVIISWKMKLRPSCWLHLVSIWHDQSISLLSRKKKDISHVSTI